MAVFSATCIKSNRNVWTSGNVLTQCLLDFRIKSLLQHADGEILAARAAERMNVPFTLSTMSICSIEDLALNTTKPFWFQVYMVC